MCHTDKHIQHIHNTSHTQKIKTIMNQKIFSQILRFVPLYPRLCNFEFTRPQQEMLEGKPSTLNCRDHFCLVIPKLYYTLLTRLSLDDLEMISTLQENMYRMYTNFTYLNIGTWVATDFDIDGDPGTRPLRYQDWIEQIKLQFLCMWSYVYLQQKKCIIYSCDLSFREAIKA